MFISTVLCLQLFSIDPRGLAIWLIMLQMNESPDTCLYCWQTAEFYEYIWSSFLASTCVSFGIPIRKILPV